MDARKAKLDAQWKRRIRLAAKTAGAYAKGGFMARGRSVWGRFALMLAFGGLELYFVMRTPRFQEIRNIDIVQLMVSGLCFGVALSILIGAMRGRTTE
jgi:hypothetical protein